MLDQRANAAQVAFAFFADVSGEARWSSWYGCASRKERAPSQQGGETRAVVGDSRADEALPAALDANVRASRKNRIEMRDEQDNATFGVRAGTLANHVAEVVGADVQACSLKKLLQGQAPGGFAEFRGGDFVRRIC